MKLLQILLVLKLSVATEQSLMPFDFQRVNREVVDAMRRAWKLTDYGRSLKEAGVVVMEEPDGRYSAKVQFSAERWMSVELNVPANAVAIFHTHPNNVGYAPSPEDKKNSDMLQIPGFIMTDRGLWAYSPQTRTTTQVMVMISWLDLRNWQR